MRLPALLVVLPLLTAVATSAAAQDALDRADVERARVHFEAGIQHYDDGHFEDAAREFEAAFQLTGHPDVLYNLAQSYDRLERFREAIANYRRYLDESSPDSPERGRVERRVRELETLQSVREAEERQAVEEAQEEGEAREERAVVTEPPPAPAGPSPLPFITMGVGGASIVAAIAFGVAASSIHGDLEARCGVDGRCTGFDPAADRDRGATFATLADVFGIAGGLILGAGVVLLAIELTDDRDEATLAITTGPAPLGAGARLRF